MKPAQDFKQLFDAADSAGKKAVIELEMSGQIRPMIVQAHDNPLDDNSPVNKQWYVPDGPCGFAWITIKPGNCAFAKWLTKNDLARKAYGGGVSVWVGDYNQSIQKKECYAYAFAKELNKQGINARTESRMD